jgi:hypothetical protein
MKTEPIHNASSIGSALPVVVRNALKKYAGKVWLAGGAVRAKLATIPEPVRDYDLFCASEDIVAAP